MIKWIGHHIWDFITRFRNDVYFESIASSSETNVLVVDAAGKVTSNSSLGGGVTSVTATSPIVSSGGTTPDVSVNTGAVVNGGSGLATQDQIHDFVVGQGYTSNIGDITRATVNADTGSVDTTSGDFDVTISGGDALSTSVTGSTLSISVDNASESSKGVVELATTAEADAGTDAVRAVTPEGLKSHVDTRYSYQYYSFIGISDNDTNWAAPHQNGWIAHGNKWSTNLGNNSTTIGTTFTLSRAIAVTGFTVPVAGILVGFNAIVRNNEGDNQSHVGLIHDTYANIGGKTGSTNSWALRAYAAVDKTGGAGNSYFGPCEAVDLSRSLALSAGDQIIPVIMEETGNKVYFNITMVIKTLIPQ